MISTFLNCGDMLPLSLVLTADMGGKESLHE